MEGYSHQQGANGAAHSLARLALSGEMECIWFDNCPPPVLEIVSVEQT
jgi:hypothetical protein